MASGLSAVASSQATNPAQHGLLLTARAFWGSYWVVVNQRQFRGLDPVRRALAVSLAVLIFVLGIFAASPVLHGQLHHHTDQHQEDGCAIVLFAGGVALTLATNVVPPTTVEWQASRRIELAEIFLDSPRYLLRPERGPPVV